jgi:hypothetical protein
MDDEPFDRGRRGMLGLVLMAALMIAGGLGLMMWDDRRDRDGTPTLLVP